MSIKTGLVRLAFHDAGSYDINTNTGGPHADVDLNAGENKGLKRVTDLLEPIYLKNNGKISRADLSVLLLLIKCFVYMAGFHPN